MEGNRDEIAERVENVEIVDREIPDGKPRISPDDGTKQNSPDAGQSYSLNESLSSNEGVSQSDEFYSAKDFHLVNDNERTSRICVNDIRPFVDEILIETCLVKQKNYDVPIEIFRRDIVEDSGEIEKGIIEDRCGEEREENGHKTDCKVVNISVKSEDVPVGQNILNNFGADPPSDFLGNMNQPIPSGTERQDQCSDSAQSEIKLSSAESPAVSCTEATVNDLFNGVRIGKRSRSNADNIEYDSLNSDSYSSNGSSESVDRIGLESNEVVRPADAIQTCAKCNDDARVIFNEFKPYLKQVENRPVKVKLSNLENGGSFIYNELYNIDDQRFLNNGPFKDSLDNNDPVKDKLSNNDNSPADTINGDNLEEKMPKKEECVRDTLDETLLKNEVCVEVSQLETRNFNDESKKDDSFEDRSSKNGDSVEDNLLKIEKCIKESIDGALSKTEASIADAIKKESDQKDLNIDSSDSNDRDETDRHQESADRASADPDDKPALTEYSLEKRTSLFRKMSTLPLGNGDSKKGNDSKSA